MLSGFELKNKLRISFLFLVIFSAITGIVSILFMSRAGEYNALLKIIQTYTVTIQEVREAEQNFVQYDRKEVQFLETGKSVNHSHIINLMDSLNLLNNQLTESRIFKRLSTSKNLVTLSSYLKQYKINFDKLALTYKKRGFYNHGLEVEMRSYIHDLQESPSAAEQVFAYKLRRNEKDFMLRSDEKYVLEFKKNIAGFKNLVSTENLSHATPTYINETLAKIETYEFLFLQLVDFERELGLSESQGLKGMLKENFTAAFPLLEELTKELNTTYERLIQLAYLSLIIGLILLLAMGVWLSIVLSRVITRPVLTLDNVIKKAAQGDYSSTTELSLIDKRDEIGRLAGNFIQLLRTIENQFKEIADKNSTLEITSAEDAKRNWASEGLAKLTELINRKQNLNKTLDSVLSTLVTYTRGSQGSIFIVNQSDENNPILELKSYYAYERRKFLTKTIQPGEGLLGTAWLEKDTVVLTEIPNGYLHITSGLGEATPSFLLIVPMITNDTVEGMVELAYFHRLQNHEIEFLKTVGERLASSISTLRIHERTQKLLVDSQVMMEQLRAQEEEMRQNMEELHATQEEMERKVKESQSHIGNLSMEVTMLEKWVNAQSKWMMITDALGMIKFITKNFSKSIGSEQVIQNEMSFSDLLPNVILKNQPELIEGILSTRNGEIPILYRCVMEEINDAQSFIVEIEMVETLVEL